MNKILIILTACFIFLLTDRAMADAGGTIGARAAIDAEGIVLSAGYRFNSILTTEGRWQYQETRDAESNYGLYTLWHLPITQKVHPYAIAAYTKYKDDRGGHDKSALGFGVKYKILSNISTSLEVVEVDNIDRVTIGCKLEF